LQLPSAEIRDREEVPSLKSARQSNSPVIIARGLRLGPV
jgi:hypothetical protein